MNKIWESVEAAVADIEDGAAIAIGGFFAGGVPRILLRALIDKGTKALTLCCGSGPLLGATSELEALVKKKQIRKVIDSYALFRSATKGSQHVFEQHIRSGMIELEVYPMGTLAEKYRAAGAGIPAFFSPAGGGSMAAESILSNIAEHRKEKEVRVIDGQSCLLEYALKPDIAFVHAYRSDIEGNLQYRKTARNFNHVMAMAARVTIVEAENVVSSGQMDPETIHTAGIYVQRVVAVPRIQFDITNL
jgi:3-oxoacid CoA-transferase A subunit